MMAKTSHTARREISVGVGTSPSLTIPIPDTKSTERGEHDRDNRETGHELAENHLVAVDRLGEEPWERPL